MNLSESMNIQETTPVIFISGKNQFQLYRIVSYDPPIVSLASKKTIETVGNTTEDELKTFIQTTVLNRK